MRIPNLDCRDVSRIAILRRTLSLLSLELKNLVLGTSLKSYGHGQVSKDVENIFLLIGLS